MGKLKLKIVDKHPALCGLSLLTGLRLGWRCVVHGPE